MSGESLETSSFGAEPVLPSGDPAVPAPDAPAPPPAGHGRGVQTGYVAYRSDQDRSRRVYRRANPVWRRLLRGVIALALSGAVAVGVYYGAREVQHFLDRDRLPSPGLDLPQVGWSTFLLRSVPPGPELDGTLRLDLTSGAYEFVGRTGGPQAGVRLARQAGGTPRIDTGGGWRDGAADRLVGALDEAIGYVRGVLGPDDVLEARLRRDFVDLLDRQTDVTATAELTRYEMSFDTAAFSSQYPVQWAGYETAIAPALEAEPLVPVTMVLDESHVVVRLEAPRSGWAWERLEYGAGSLVGTIAPD